MPTVSWEKWESRWAAALKSSQRLGGKTYKIERAEPATSKDIEAVEAELGFRIPGTFRTVLEKFSSHAEFGWQLPKGIRSPIREIFSGGCYWELSSLVQLEQTRQDWVKSCFPNENDPYDRVWHNKLLFLFVPNGDRIALDLALPTEPPVVYLSHDGGEGHGYLLGDSFMDFMDRWSLLGCPGPEGWQMMPFLPSPTAGLDPNCDRANAWRTWFDFVPAI